MVSVEAKPLARPTMAVNSHVVRGAMVKWTVVLTGAMVGRGAVVGFEMKETRTDGDEETEDPCAQRREGGS